MKGKMLKKIGIIGVFIFCFLLQVDLAQGDSRIKPQNKKKSNVPMEIELNFSSVPMLNEPAVLDVEIRALKDAPSTLIDIELPGDGFKLISGNTQLNEDLSSGSTTIYQLEVLPVALGQYKITASATSGGTDYIFGKREVLYVNIGDGFSELSKASFSSELSSHRSGAIKIGDMSEPPTQVPPDHKSMEDQEFDYLAAPGPGQIAVKGYWFYQDKEGADRPLRDAKVEIWDSDTSGDTLLETTHTDNSGFYASGNISNNDSEGGGQDIYVKVFSTDDRSVRVTDFSSPSNLYYSDTEVQNDVSDGEVNLGSYSLDDSNNRMAWYIYDVIANDAFDYLAVNVGWRNLYNLQVRWSPTNTTRGTYYRSGGSIDLLAGDRWDSDVFLHEYGHFVMYKIYGDSIPPSPSCYNHYWGSHSSMGCAWTEGWANFLQAAIQNDRYYDDTEDQILHINFEPPTPGASHAEDEGAVAASLWDIFDTASTTESWDAMGNGINGASNNGIWSIAYNDDPVDFLEFYSYWINSSNGYNAEITAILQHHQIDPGTGSLEVTIAPPAAVTAGAQWRVDGGSWRNSGQAQSGLSLGSHTVEFKALSGWSKPGNKTATINLNKTTNANGSYTQQTGSLKVTIAPSAAVTAGAQWRVDAGSWRNSGQTQSGLSLGSHTVEFKALSGWSKPGNKTATINYNQTTNAGGTYTRQSGSLKVTITPLGARSAGAKWRVDGGSWHNSGQTQSGLSLGSHTVSFKDVSGWVNPSNKTATINYNQTTNAGGTYTRQSGSLKVTITPLGARSAGAKWRVDGGSWHNSGQTQSGFSIGSHTVSFKDVSGWVNPGNKTATINYNQTTNAGGTYTRQTGSLKVTIAPSAAVTAGAQWRVDAGSWRNSGQTQSGLSLGSHTVEFKALSGWSKPGNKTATINYNQTTNTNGTYTKQTGSLKVSITPSGAVSAGAQWRVDGGSWRNSGQTQSGLSIGSHTVSFKNISGWVKPGNKSETINANGTTNAGGTYTRETTVPSISITSPTSNPTHSTSNISLDIAGTASDNVAVISVNWTNSRGGSGPCTLTSSWSKSGIELSSGENIITVTAIDAAGNTGTDTLTVTYIPPDAPPEIVEEACSPHDAQGMEDDTLRVPNDTSIVTRMKSLHGIDEDNVDMRIDEKSVGIRVQEVIDGDDTDVWIIHSPNTPFAFDQTVNFSIDAQSLNGAEMDTYYSSFKIESEEEYDAALAKTPASTEYPDDPAIGQNTVVADPGTAIEGAEIIYGNLEPVAPRFGPLEEIPNLDVVTGVGLPLNLQPANVFVDPVSIFIPCPGETDLGILEIYVFNPATGWQASWETDGFIVAGSRVNHGPNDPDPTEPATIEVQLNHFSSVQAGKPTDPILPSAGAGDEKGGGGGGGGGGGCFITAAAGMPQMLKPNALALMLLFNVGFAGYAGVRRKLKK